jgi:hypothetical protein
MATGKPTARSTFNSPTPQSAWWVSRGTDGPWLWQGTGRPIVLEVQRQLLGRFGDEREWEVPAGPRAGQTVVLPGDPRGRQAGYVVFRDDGALGAGSLTLLFHAARADADEPAQAAIRADLEHRRVSPRTLAYALKLAWGRPGDVVELPSDVVPPPFGVAPPAPGAGNLNTLAERLVGPTPGVAPPPAPAPAPGPVPGTIQPAGPRTLPERVGDAVARAPRWALVTGAALALGAVALGARAVMGGRRS